MPSVSQQLDLHAERAWFGNRLHIFVTGRVKSGSIVAQPAMFVERPEDSGEVILPMLNISMEEGQRLMDELWGCGLRPTEGSGSAGSLASTERHLKDMQAIAFGLLSLDQPPRK
jgi:hypothetical protein